MSAVTLIHGVLGVGRREGRRRQEAVPADAPPSKVQEPTHWVVAP